MQGGLLLEALHIYSGCELGAFVIDVQLRGVCVCERERERAVQQHSVERIFVICQITFQYCCKTEKVKIGIAQGRKWCGERCVVHVLC
jgi:hypothetical protein